jgi:hypothetical protein
VKREFFNPILIVLICCWLIWVIQCQLERLNLVSRLTISKKMKDTQAYLLWGLLPWSESAIELQRVSGGFLKFMFGKLTLIENVKDRVNDSFLRLWRSRRRRRSSLLKLTVWLLLNCQFCPSCFDLFSTATTH